MINYGALKSCHESRILSAPAPVLYYFATLPRPLYEGTYVFENDACE